MIRVAVICPWFFRGDAVGAAAKSSHDALAQDPRLHVSAIGLRNDYPDLPMRQADGVADLLLTREFLEADVLIYHYAVYQEYFGALLLGNGHGRQVLRFHNVTPTRFMPRETWPIISRSFQQIPSLDAADEVWADSRENADELISRGFRRECIRVLPLSVDRPDWTALQDKEADRVELLYVGRFFSSKGVLDLLAAADVARQATEVAFRLRLVGNLQFSHPPYVAEIREQIGQRGLGDVVEMVGSVEQPVLEAIYAQTHILATASYHEGFCVPVIEGMRAGCIPVSYAAANLRYVADGLGRLAPMGDVAALGRALAETLSVVPAALAAPDQAVLRLDRGRMSAEAYSEAAHAHAAAFSFAHLRRNMTERVLALAASSAHAVR
ncbi:MAG: glycosyltransferase family 4 protein [Janthinobacterium lividum]